MNVYYQDIHTVLPRTHPWSIISLYKNEYSFHRSDNCKHDKTHVNVWNEGLKLAALNQPKIYKIKNQNVMKLVQEK